MNRNHFIATFLFILLVGGISPLYGQDDLEKMLEGKTTLSAIMPIVDEYYKEDAERISSEGEVESNYLQWKRWEWYMSNHLGPAGEFVNISDLLMRGLEEKEKMNIPDQDRNINSAWTFMGPNSTPLQNPDALTNGLARVDGIVFHPSNANIIFIYTPAGGLWSTLNGGSTWNNLTDHLPCIGFSGFVISYANTSDMYLLTGEGNSGYHPLGYGRSSIGVLKSIDGGVSWHQTGTFPNTGGTYYGYALAQSPTDPMILIAATSTGLYRTTNGGTSWAKEEGGLWWDIKFKPGDGTRVYATKNHAFYISTDSGDTWTSNSTFNVSLTVCDTFGGDRTLIAVSPTIPAKVFLLAAPRLAAGSFCGTWLSTDNGASFTRQATTPNIYGSNDAGSDDTDQTDYDMAFTCQSNLSTTIYAAGCTIWKSTNNGGSWVHVTSYNEGNGYPYIHPDIHCIAFNPLNNWLYAATDGGFFRSQDLGATWTNFSNGIGTSQFYHMAGWDGNINKLLGGLQDNGIKYRKDNTSAFYHMNCCDGFDIVFNPVNGEPGFGTINTYMMKYSSNGTHSVVCTPPNNQFFKTIAVHNTDTTIALAGSGSGIFRSLSSGNYGTWTNEGGMGSWALTACPSNNTRFYAAGGSYYYPGPGGGLYFSNNTGDTWTIKSFTSGFPDTSQWRRINDIAVLPTNSSVVYACFGGFSPGVKVVMSNNTGDSWTNISLNLPNIPVNSLAVDNNNGVYAGTDIGVFYKAASMPNWMPWSNGLPNVPVSDLVIFDDGVTKRLRAATFGRGVWQSNLASTCDAAVIVTGNLEGIEHFEASTSITSSGFIQGGIGTFVSFKSGNYITLSDGFNVIDDSEFLGFISPCGQGGIPSFGGEPPINRSDPRSSIILLRRMWDPVDELPFGFIDQVKLNRNTAHITYTIKRNGHTELIAAREIQETLHVLMAGEISSGKHELDVSLKDIPDEFHYLLLFYEGQLVHFQEMDLREKEVRITNKELGSLK